MIKKVLCLLVWGAILTIPIFALEEPMAIKAASVQKVEPTSPVVASVSKKIDSVVVSNQMMITFMERMKNGDIAEARDLAHQMIEGHETLKNTHTTEYKSFSSLFGEKLYEILQKREGRNVKIQWVQQPIADGFYFLSMLSFQEGKLDEAFKYIEKAIDWDPVRAAFLNEKGFIMVHQSNRLDLSLCFIPYLKAAELADNPSDFATALCGLGYIYIEKGNLETGLACYMRAKNFDPSNPAASKEIAFIKAIAPKLANSMDMDKAALILKQDNVPYLFDPIHVQIRLSLANSLSPTQNKKELKAILRHALSLEPNNSEVKNKLSALK